VPQLIPAGDEVTVPLPFPALLMVRVEAAANGTVFTPNGTEPVDVKLIQPMFSPQASPANTPVVGEIVTPKSTVPQLFVLTHEKKIHPTFSPQAQPEMFPAPSLSTP
jgi:hypothetical protein